LPLLWGAGDPKKQHSRHARCVWTSACVRNCTTDGSKV